MPYAPMPAFIYGGAPRGACGFTVNIMGVDAFSGQIE